MIKRFVLLMAAFVAISFLVSCATYEGTTKTPQKVDSTINNALFNEWNDVAIQNAAVAKLIKQADIMMKYEQWGEAQGRLERCLRVSIDYAPTWSRLSWLSLRAAKHNKAIQLAHRSNSYTASKKLQRLNWTIIRDAYKLMGKSEEMSAASKVLNQLKGARF